MPMAVESSAEEARLAQQAAAGSGEAFAELYERYERRAYNLCYRILGSEDDAADATQEAFVGLLRRLPSLEGRDLAFGSYLFTSARNACYDLIERRRRAEPSDEIPESSIPVGGGTGGGGFGFDPGDPEDDPERNVLLDARQEEIRAANATLPERQREALALKELEELSYDEIAAVMGMNRNSVAQLISRARINLRDALRGSALASIAAATPDCERALALMAAGQDEQPVEDAAWAELHTRDCETCRLSREAMDEAGLSYRSWIPIAAAPVLFRETMAEAAEAVGADWSPVVARRERSRGERRSGHGSRLGLSGSSPVLAHRRRDLVLIGVLALALVTVVFAGATSDDEPPVGTVGVADEAAQEVEAEPGATEETSKPAKKGEPAGKKKGDGESPGAGPAKESENRNGNEPGAAKEKQPGGAASGDEAASPGARTRQPGGRGREGQGGATQRPGNPGSGDEPTGAQPPARTSNPADSPPSDPTPADPPPERAQPDPPPTRRPEPPPPREQPPERVPPPVRQPPAGTPGTPPRRPPPTGVPGTPPRPAPPPPRRPPP